MLEIGLYDVSTGIQVVDVERSYVIGVAPDYDGAVEKIEAYCELNGVYPEDVVIEGDYL